MAGELAGDTAAIAPGLGFEVGEADDLHQPSLSARCPHTPSARKVGDGSLQKVVDAFNNEEPVNVRQSLRPEHA
jgi:hypothetical protein